MTRVLKNVASDESVQFPVAVPAYMESEYEPTRIVGLRKNREFAPYQPGEMLLVNVGSAADPDIKLARVYCVIPHMLETRGYYIPLYRVQLCTKAGKWSRQWRDLFPGNVFRAYHDAEDNRRAMPEQVTLEWLNGG